MEISLSGRAAIVTGGSKGIGFAVATRFADTAGGTSFDHLVGDGEYRWRHLDAERARRLKIDDELELGRLQHRQIGGLGALEDLPGIGADLTTRLREVLP
jgi:NAD(P)-dependent dehydrogenase (short-subunit alcohol dehydrogenase family)